MQHQCLQMISDNFCMINGYHLRMIIWPHKVNVSQMIHILHINHHIVDRRESRISFQSVDYIISILTWFVSSS
jgi:hypothetical protein